MELNKIKFIDLESNVKQALGGATYFNSQISYDLNVPTNIPFNKTLYMKRGNELIAMKFLMASYFSCGAKKDFDKNLFSKCLGSQGEIYGWFFYIQTPYGTEWTRIDGKTRFFNSIEDYYTHLESGCCGFHINYDYMFKVFFNRPQSISFKDAWKWNGHCAEPCISPIKNIIINEDGFHAVLTCYSGEYLSKESCIKANVEGLKIVEFPQTENSIKLTIEVVKTPPIVKTLSFIEG